MELGRPDQSERLFSAYWAEKIANSITGIVDSVVENRYDIIK